MRGTKTVMGGGLFVRGGDVKRDELESAAEPPGTERGGLVIMIYSS